MEVIELQKKGNVRERIIYIYKAHAPGFCFPADQSRAVHDETTYPRIMRALDTLNLYFALFVSKRMKRTKRKENLFTNNLSVFVCEMYVQEQR